MANIYRVLMEDQVNQKAFRFAIFVEGKHELTFEQMAHYERYGFNVEDANRWAAQAKAWEEFPSARVIKSRLDEVKSFLNWV